MHSKFAAAGAGGALAVALLARRQALRGDAAGLTP